MCLYYPLTGSYARNIDECQKYLQHEPTDDNTIESCMKLLLEEGDVDGLRSLFYMLEKKG